MMICPVCETIVKKENQDYCLVCAWEFEYYFDELSNSEQSRYEKRLKIYKSIYKKSIDDSKVQNLQKELEEKKINFNKLEKKYSELKKMTIEKVNVYKEEVSTPLLLDKKKEFDVKLRFLNKSMMYFIWNSIIILFRISVLLVTFIFLMMFTHYLGVKEVSSSIINSIVTIEGFLFLWVVVREFKRLLIGKELVQSDEKSPILYFIGSWIGFIIYIPLEILKYLFYKVKK